jgi:hypothetical protein
MAGLRPPALLPLLALGCTAGGGEEAAMLMQQALVSAQASLAAAGGGARAPAASSAAAAPGAAMPATVRVPVAPPPGRRLRGTAPPAAAAALTGARAEQLRRMLGEPALRRAEGEAEIWLYEAPACRLDIILYAEGGALVVAHAAARAHGSDATVTEAACLSAIAAAPNLSPWGAAGRRA